MYPHSVPPLDHSPGEGKSLATNPAQQQPEACPRGELSTQLNPVANNDCDSKRCSSDLTLSSNESETGMLEKSNGDPAKSLEGLSTMGGAEHQTSDTQSTRTGSSINCSEPLVLNQPIPHSKDGFDLGTQNRHRNFEPATAFRGSTPSNPDASTGDSRGLVVNDDKRSSTNSDFDLGTQNRHRNFEPATAFRGSNPSTPDAITGDSRGLVVNDDKRSSTNSGSDLGTQNRHRNFEPATAFRGSTPSTPDASTGHSRGLVVNDDKQSSTNSEIWTTRADGHLSKNRMAAESLSGLKSHSSGESLVSNDPRILERRKSSLAIRNVSEPTSTDQIEPGVDKQAQKDSSRRNGSALGNLFTGKWLRTVVESKTPQVNPKDSRRQGPASSTTCGTGDEIYGDEITDLKVDSHPIPNAEAGDAASITSSRQTTININAIHDGSMTSRTTTPPATPGLPAEQSETVPEVAPAKRAMKGATREGKSSFHQGIPVPATSAPGSPLNNPTYPLQSHTVNKGTAAKPGAANSGDLRLTITFKDGISHGAVIRRAKVTILLETEDDLMVEANAKKAEQGS